MPDPDRVRRLNGVLRRLPTWPVYAAGVAYPVWLMWQGVGGALGADPVKVIERSLGLWALKLLVAGLCITPLRRWTGISLLRFRRALGVTAFVMAVAHLAAWLVLDMGLLWGQALADIAKRPYVTMGMTAISLMLPLALTSTDAAVRSLGAQRWQRVHRLVYPAALAAAVHYLWLVKTWQVAPFLYLAAIAALLVFRLRWRRARPARVAPLSG